MTPAETRAIVTVSLLAAFVDGEKHERERWPACCRRWPAWRPRTLPHRSSRRQSRLPSTNITKVHSCVQPRNSSWPYADKAGGGVGKVAEPVIRAQM